MESDKFSVRVAGTSFRQREISKIDVGDEVTLVPEPDNQHDPMAIKVMVGNRQIGYIPKDKNESIGLALSGGCTITEATVMSMKMPEGSESYGVLIEFTVNYPD